MTKNAPSSDSFSLITLLTWALSWATYRVEVDDWDRRCAEAGRWDLPAPKFDWHPDRGARVERPGRADRIFPLLRRVEIGAADPSSGLAIDEREEIRQGTAYESRTGPPGKRRGLPREASTLSRSPCPCCRGQAKDKGNLAPLQGGGAG
jgi:hypothetical protein